MFKSLQTKPSFFNSSAPPLLAPRKNTDYQDLTVDADQKELTGTVVFIKSFNGWAIGKFRTADHDVISIKGNPVSNLQMDTDYVLTGTMKSHPKYGWSFDVLGYAPHIKLDPKAIRKYLTKNFKGVGEKTSEKMVNLYMQDDPQGGLEKLRQQIINSPWSIDWSVVGREGKFEGEKEGISSYIERDLATKMGAIPNVDQPVIAGLALYLEKELKIRHPMKKQSNVSLGSTLVTDEWSAAKIELPVEKAWEILAADPYMPIRFVSGYGFQTADAIGRMLDFDFHCEQRLRALVHHALDEHCNQFGHAFLTESQMIRAIAQIDQSVDHSEAIDFGLNNDMIILDGEKYYTPELHRYEVNVSEKISNLMDYSAALLPTVTDAQIQMAYKQTNPHGMLDPSQVHAVKSMLTNKSKIHVLTGGPGCGKTALVETFIKLLPKQHFQFCAPTGKASKVLSNRISSTGYAASTIHSLFVGGDGLWQVNADAPLMGNILVVDESSMPSLELWSAVLNGMNESMHLLVVGDPDQLPSIQAGRVLADILALEGVNHSHLTQVHRNSGGILDVVQEIRDSALETRNRESVVFSGEIPDANKDFATVVAMYKEAVARSGVENVLLLMSRRAGKEDIPGWNTTYANAVLKDVFNPNGMDIPGCKYKVKDRVIIRKNMTIAISKNDKAYIDVPAKQEIRVVNGDTGMIRSFEMDANNPQNGAAKNIEILLDDGRCVLLPGTDAKHLQYAYALTVHAAQGSEYKEIMAVFTPGAPSFINRNMILTGVSRAKEKLHVFANDDELKKMCLTPQPKRNSSLTERIMSEQKEKRKSLEFPAKTRSKSLEMSF